LKGCQIRALEDGQGIGIVSSEGEKGHVIPFRDISVGGVIISVNFIPVPRERGKDKNTWTGKRRHRRGGGKSSRHRGGGRKGSLFNKIHIFFFVVTLAGRESQRQVDNKGENDRADEANGRALG